MNILHNGAISLYHGDCLDVMHEIPDGSADAIICDLPYGTTACKWDVVIPFEPMWAALKRIIKPRGAIVLFGSQPFTSALIMSNVGMFRYEWIWNKVTARGFQIAKVRPMQQHENVMVFAYDTMKYFPIMIDRDNPKKSRVYGKSESSPLKHYDGKTRTYTQWYPKSIIVESNANQKNKLHPTQKPVALLEYLIRTYTNPDETVLDFTFGSCTAGVAALNTKRRFIGIERDATYYALGVQRVQTAIDNLPPMDV